MEDLNNNQEINDEVLVNDDSNNMVLSVDDTVTNVLVSDPSKCYQKDVKTKITEYQEDQGERIFQIKKSVETASKNKAILSLKYDYISFKISCIQISVIVFSALITFIETLNGANSYEMFHDRSQFGTNVCNSMCLSLSKFRATLGAI